MTLRGRVAAIWLAMMMALSVGTGSPAAAQDTPGEYRTSINNMYLEMRALWGELDRFKVANPYCNPSPPPPSKAQAQAELASLEQRANDLNQRYNALKQSLLNFLDHNHRLYAEMMVNGRDPRDRQWWTREDNNRQRMLDELARKKAALAAAREVDCRPKPKPQKPAVTTGGFQAPTLPVIWSPTPATWPALPKHFCSYDEKIEFLKKVAALLDQAGADAERAARFRTEVEQAVNSYVQSDRPVPPELIARRRQAIADVEAANRRVREANDNYNRANAIPVIDCRQPQQEPPRASPPPPPKPEPDDLRTPVPPKPVSVPPSETGLNPEDIRRMSGQQTLIGEIEGGIARLEALRLAGKCNELVELEDEISRDIRMLGMTTVDNPDGTRSRLATQTTIDELRRRANAAARPCPPSAQPGQDARTGQPTTVRPPSAPGLSPGDGLGIASQQRTIENFEAALDELQALFKQGNCAAAWDLVEELDDWLDYLEGMRPPLSLGGPVRLTPMPRIPTRLIHEWDDRIEDIIENCPRPGRPQIRLDVSTILDQHNSERAIYGYEPLRWSFRLADNAQTYADQLASTGQRVHSSREGRGIERENLSQGLLGWSTSQMMASWFDEKRYFRPGVFPDISTTGDWAKVGHYSQGIWPTTTSIGCGIASGSGYKWFLCRYSPGGNKDGHSVGLPQMPSPRTMVAEPMPSPRHMVAEPMPQPRGEVARGDIAPPNSSTTVRPPLLPVPGGGMTQIDPPAPPPPPPPTARDDAPEGKEENHPLNSYFNEASARHAAAVDCGDRAAQEAEMAKMRYALDELKKRLKDARRAAKLGISAVKPADVQKQIDEAERKMREAEQRKPREQCPTPPAGPQVRGIVTQPVPQ